MVEDPGGFVGDAKVAPDAVEAEVEMVEDVAEKAGDHLGKIFG